MLFLGQFTLHFCQYPMPFDIYIHDIYILFNLKQTNLLFKQWLTYFMQKWMLQHYGQHKRMRAHWKPTGVTCFFFFAHFSDYFIAVKYNERNSSFLTMEWNTYFMHHDVLKCHNYNSYNASTSWPHLLWFSACFLSQKPPYIQPRLPLKIQKLVATHYGFHFMQTI
jgi:hypothetical protein